MTELERDNDSITIRFTWKEFREIVSATTQIQGISAIPMGTTADKLWELRNGNGESTQIQPG